MKKTLKSFIFVSLCLVYSCHIKSEYTFNDIPTAVTAHPKISALIAVLIYLVGYKIFFANKNDDNAVIKRNPIIKISRTEKQTTLVISPLNSQHEQCYPLKLHNCESSPQNTYIVTRHLKKLSILSAFTKAILHKLDAVTTIQQFLINYFFHRIIDPSTGEVIMSLDNVQQCTISPNEKYVLTRTTVNPMSYARRVWTYFSSPIPSLPTKDYSWIQYDVIDLATKKVVKSFSNIAFAEFIADDTLMIITSNDVREYYKPEHVKRFNPLASSTVFSKISLINDQPNSSMINNEKLINAINEFDKHIKTIHFYYNHPENVQTLNIEFNDKPPLEILHVRRYSLRGNHLCIEVDNTADKHFIPENFLPKGLGGFMSKIKKMDKLVSSLKPHILFSLVDLTSGMQINPTQNENSLLYLYSKNIMLLAHKGLENSISYKQFNLQTRISSDYNNGHAIMITPKKRYKVVDPKNCTCAASLSLVTAAENSRRIIQEIAKLYQESGAEQTIQETINDAEKDLQEITNDLQKLGNQITDASQSALSFLDEQAKNTEKKFQEIGDDVENTGRSVLSFLKNIVKEETSPLDNVRLNNCLYASFCYDRNQNYPLIRGKYIHGIVIDYHKDSLPKQLEHIKNFLQQNKLDIISLVIQQKTHFSKKNKDEVKTKETQTILTMIKEKFAGTNLLLSPNKPNPYIRDMKKEGQRLAIYQGNEKSDITLPHALRNPSLFDFSYSTEEEYETLKPIISHYSSDFQISC